MRPTTPGRETVAAAHHRPDGSLHRADRRFLRRPGPPQAVPAGNRQINRVLHIMAVVQLRNPTEGRAYYDRKVAAGKPPAKRCAPSNAGCLTSPATR
jgi:hypothetical protein